MHTAVSSAIHKIVLRPKKNALIVNICNLLFESSEAAEALQALWTEVVRCNGDGSQVPRGASVDYDACLTALGGGDDDGAQHGTFPVEASERLDEGWGV